MAWKNFRDLIVWQKSMQLVDEVYRITVKMPRTEDYALSSQMRRSVISIPSNIAEGQGRDGKKDFIRFLSIARGSLYELETQLDICESQKYINSDEKENLISLCDEIDKMLNKLAVSIDKTSNF